MKKIYKFLFLFLPVIILSPFTPALSYDITGTIYDLKTSEPIPFATVKVLDKNVGTTSDENGYYILKVESGLHRVVFSYIGYFSDTALINVEDSDEIRDVHLNPSEIFIEEIIVAGEDPAYEIIRRAIKYKKEFQKKLQNYEYEAYSKYVLRSNTPSPTAKNGDSLSGDKMAIFGILESETRGYFKKPDQFKEIILAKKETANITRGFALPLVLNFYDEVLDLNRVKIPGPLADDAFDNYEYKLTGTTSIDSLLIYEIQVINQSNLSPQFYGEILISDSIFALMKVDLHTNDAINLRGIDKANFQQKFGTYTDAMNNEYWMPTDIQIFAGGSFAGIAQFKGEIYSVISQYKINETIPPGVFDDFIIKVMPDAKKDSAYWTENQVIKSTREELSAYTLIEEDEKKKANEIRFNLTELKFGKYISSKPLNYYHFNRVEGNFLQFNAEYRNELGKDDIEGYAGYGFSDEKFKYDINYTKRLLKDRSLRLSLGFFDRLNILSYDLFGLAEFENSMSGLFFKEDRYDYFYSTGYDFSVDYTIIPQLSVDLDFRQEKQTTAIKNTDFSFFKGDQDFKDNPRINDAFLRKTGIRFRIDPNEFKFIDWGDGDISRVKLSRFPVISLGLTYSNKDLMKSTYEFKKYYATLWGAENLAPYFNPSYRVEAEYISGEVPFQELSYFNTSRGAINTSRNFKTLTYQEFLGDEMLALYFENNFGKYLWGNIPILKEFNLIGFYNAGKMNIRDENKQLALYKSFSGTNGFFQEAGFGIGGILGLFRVDFGWRLNNFKEGENFKVVLSLEGFRQ
jgi:hypothetical protein